MRGGHGTGGQNQGVDDGCRGRRAVDVTAVGLPDDGAGIGIDERGGDVAAPDIERGGRRMGNDSGGGPSG